MTDRLWQGAAMAKPVELDRPAYVVLGMVWLGARSGYEIKQAVEMSIRFFWTISQAQIYPSLKALERAGLVKGRSEPLGKRRRRTYEITAAGSDALRVWLCRDEAIPFELRDVGLLKLFFAGALDASDARTLLTAMKRRSEHYVANLRTIEPVAKRTALKSDPHALLTLAMGIAFHQAMVEVCARFEQGRPLLG
jgi:DNA-binding PadR family transcriptional regulator